LNRRKGERNVMGKRRRKMRIRKRKWKSEGGCEGGRQNYTAGGQNMDNVEKINREEVRDRRKMEVEEGHLTV